MYVMRGFSAAKSLVMGIKLPKKFLHLFAEAALFLLSFSIYFSLSSNLFNHTNFWFFLTNTLIFIIAADSGAFSPPSSFVAATDTVPTLPKDFNKIVVVKEPPNSPILTQNEEEEERIIPLTTEKTSIPPKFNNLRNSYQRSKSEKEIKRLGERAGKITMKRSKTMMIRHDMTTTKKKEEEKDEFAEMTNEELNRRVEKFIERFNRQIRLQEMNEHDNENRELLI